MLGMKNLTIGKKKKLSLFIEDYLCRKYKRINQKTPRLDMVTHAQSSSYLGNRLRGSQFKASQAKLVRPHLNQ
jgi:hypothetical protein